MPNIIDTFLGLDKVVTTSPVRRGIFSGQDKDHIHACSAIRHFDGSLTVTERVTGARFELRPGQVKSVGGAVDYDDDSPF